MRAQSKQMENDRPTRLNHVLLIAGLLAVSACAVMRAPTSDWEPALFAILLASRSSAI